MGKIDPKEIRVGREGERSTRGKGADPGKKKAENGEDSF